MSLHDEVTSIRPPPRAEPTQIVRTRPSAAALPTLQRLHRRRRIVRAAAIGAVIVVISAVGASIVLWLGPAAATHASAGGVARTATATNPGGAANASGTTAGATTTSAASATTTNATTASGITASATNASGATAGLAGGAVDAGAATASAGTTSPGATAAAEVTSAHHASMHRHATSSGPQANGGQPATTAPLQPLPEAPRLLSARVQFLKDNCAPRAPTCTKSIAEKWPRWSNMDTDQARDFKAEVDDCVEACARH